MRFIVSLFLTWTFFLNKSHNSFIVRRLAAAIRCVHFKLLGLLCAVIWLYDSFACCFFFLPSHLVLPFICACKSEYECMHSSYSLDCRTFFTSGLSVRVSSCYCYYAFFLLFLCSSTHTIVMCTITHAIFTNAYHIHTHTYSNSIPHTHKYTCNRSHPMLWYACWCLSSYMNANIVMWFFLFFFVRKKLCNGKRTTNILTVEVHTSETSAR